MTASFLYDNCRYNQFLLNLAKDHLHRGAYTGEAHIPHQYSLDVRGIQPLVPGAVLGGKANGQKPQGYG